MKKNKKSEFFELLTKNDKTELENYLLSHGKKPKPICPVEFVKEGNKKDDS